MTTPGTNAKVWLYNTDVCCEKILKQIESWLASLQIETCRVLEADILAVILFLDNNRFSEELLEYCRSFQQQQMLLLGVDIGPRPLPFYQIWSLLKSGVWDIFCCEEMEQLAAMIASRIKRYQIVDHVLNSDRVKKKLIGDSLIWRKTLRQVIEVASFSKAPVLILGETGTGKELIARLVHDLDRRPDKEKLILLDCSAIVPDLFGSEFFGHEKGAYTNAVSVRDGAFALAHRGTLFLDEVGELPLNLQAALLRVIQEGCYKRVGGNLWKETNFRLVSATNRVLAKEIEERQFRADLYYRISTFIISLPRLEDRREDIPILADHFIRLTLKTNEPPVLGKHLLHYLLTRDYPGNVRELQQVIYRLVQAYTGTGPLTIGHLPAFERGEAAHTADSWRKNDFSNSIRQALADRVGLKDIKRIAGDVALELAVQEAKGHLPTAAQRLGVSERLVQGWWAERKSETSEAG